MPDSVSHRVREAGSRPGRGLERVFLSLGSNLGRPARHLRRALRLLRQDPEIRVVRTSFLYKTAPVGYIRQRDFLNGVVEIRTRLSPKALLNGLRELERRMGKNTAFPGGPRNIDIDLVMYGKRHIRRRGLNVPHPRFHRRRFVLVPLAEVAPGYLHPLFRRRVLTLLKECRGAERVEQWGEW